jgi:hypothetical protein
MTTKDALKQIHTCQGITEALKKSGESHGDYGKTVSDICWGLKFDLEKLEKFVDALPVTVVETQ